MAVINNENGKFLIFSLQDSRYALNLAHIAEVGDPPEMWPIPLAPAYYHGAMNFHGDIVAAMNLSSFLGLSGQNKPGKVIILRQELASLAFLVDSIIRIVSETEVSFSAAPDTMLSSSCLTYPDGTAIQLDLEMLVRRTELDMQESRER